MTRPNIASLFTTMPGSAGALATTGAAVNVGAAAPPAVGQSLIATTPTTATWQDTVSGINPKGGMIFDHFTSLALGTDLSGSASFVILTGTGLIGYSSGNLTVGVADASHPGIVRASSAAVGQSSALWERPVWKLGHTAFDLEAVLQIQTPHSAGQSGSDRIGLGVPGDPAEFVGLIYEYATSTGFWQYRTSAGGVATSVITTVPVSTDWIRLGLSINTAGTSVEFFINGVSVGTITTNIPTAALGRLFEHKTTAGNSGTLYTRLDYFSLSYELDVAP